MKIAIRIDCTPGLGTGHAHRVANLAEVLSRLGAEVMYITSSMTRREDLPARIGGFLIETNHTRQTDDWDLTKNPPITGQAETNFEKLDAISTADICNRRGIDLLILDHYFLNQHWVNVVSQGGVLVVAIDDLGRDWNNLFALIDYSPSVKTNNLDSLGIRYKLFGLQFALLSNEYTAVSRVPQDGVERIQIFTGGSDSTGLTSRLMKILRPIINPEERILLVLGSQNSDATMLFEQWSDDMKVEIYTDLKTLSGVNAISNWSIGAGGVAAIERCCSGVPSLVLAITENQESISEELSSLGVIEYLGRHDEISDEEIKTVVERFKRDKKSRNDMATAAQERVDPFGVHRVVMRLFPNLLDLKLRSANFSDSEKLYSWVNDPLVRMNSFNNDFVAIEVHQKWFQSYLDSPSSLIYILEFDDLTIGQVRFDLRDEMWHIDYSIDSKFRGLGLGRRIVEMGLKEMASRDNRRYVALVRETNKKSQRIFESLGFTSEVFGQDRVSKFYYEFEGE
jgi:spore coat polysaccharide biosynthesis predicted glycosyltransferase SpsG/RimJ/RimL family protein N-acetyltransferase